MNYTYYRRYRPQAKKRPSSFKSFFWLVSILVILLLLLQACVRLVGSFIAEKKDEATLTVNEGSALVLEWGQTEPNPAADAQLLLVGDTVQSKADSLVTLRFADDLELHLDQNSSLLFQDAVVGDTSTTITVELLSGRVWVDQLSQEQSVELILKTKTMNTVSTQGRFLFANQDTKQYAYTFEGTLKVDYVDRSQDDSVIESVRVDKGKKTILTQEAEVALLARESLTLVGESGDDFMGDRFVMWNLGDVETVTVNVNEPDLGEDPSPDEELDPTTEVTEEATTTDEVAEVTEVPETTVQPSLCVSISSPGLSVTIQKDAIAIEGSISCGTASTVTVTWAGNGSPYVLGGFAPGDTSFRYVADASYGNLKAGSNAYTIVATAADGTQSAPVTVTINAEF